MEPLTITLVINSNTAMYLTSITIAGFIFTLSMIMFYRRFCLSNRRTRRYVKRQLHEEIDNDVLLSDEVDENDIEKHLDEDTLRMVNSCKSMMPAGKFDQIKSVVLSYASGKGDAKSLGEALHNELNIGFFLKSYIDNNSGVSQIENLRNSNRSKLAVSKIRERQRIREMNNVNILKPNVDEINDIKLELAKLKKSISKGKGKLIETVEEVVEESEDEDIVEGGDFSEDEDNNDDVSEGEDEELDYIEGEHDSCSDEEIDLDLYVPTYLLDDKEEEED